MFDREYSFTGRHAERVKSLTAKFGKFNSQFFYRNLDVYLLAPLIGFMYQNKADVEKSQETSKIFLDAMSRESRTLWFNYRLILLLDAKHEPDFDKRVDKAFRLYGKPEAKPDEDLFESHVRGGVDVLWEKIINQSHMEEDYLKNLYEFIEDFEQKYTQYAQTDTIIDLCKLARDS